MDSFHYIFKIYDVQICHIIILLGLFVDYLLLILYLYIFKALEIKRVSDHGVIFPDPDATVPDNTDENAKWLKESNSRLKLDQNALISIVMLTMNSYLKVSFVYLFKSKIILKYV